MNSITSPLILSPDRLHAVSVLIVATGTLMIATLTTMLALAARRTALAPRTQFAAPLLVATLLAAWFGWAVLAAREPVLVPEPLPIAEGLAQRVVQRPELLLEMSAMVTVGLIAIFGSKTLRAINAATPSAWLIAAQTYRALGLIFLWPFLAGGALPAGFALPAGIGDVLTGVAAPFVAWAVAHHRPGARAWARRWNWFGILDLVVAVVAAVLSQTSNVNRFPLVIVPLFLGPPLGILLHVFSLRNLAGMRDPARTAVLPEGARPANA
jgi:hypothetical protein